MEIGDIKNIIEKTPLALASVNKDGKPHNIAVENVHVKDGKIVITDKYMENTVKNIRENPFVCLVFGVGRDGWVIDGKAEYHDSGEWLDFVNSLLENKGFNLKGAIVINVREVKELS